MRKLLNSLYVMTPESYVSLDGDNVVILNGDERTGRFPLHTLESVVVFTHKGASPALMAECAKRGIALCFMDHRGRFRCRVVGESHGNVLLRKTQYRISDSEELSCDIARGFVFGKIYNSKWTIERTARDHPMRVDVGRLKRASAFLSESLDSALKCGNLNSLRGIEGQAAGVYFAHFDELILNQKDDFFFKERTKRPPTDNVNAILSFGYSILANDCASAAEGAGLDAYVGFLHRDRPGRASLGLDLMENLRCVMVDRLTLTLINNRVINKSHFDRHENGATYLNDNGRKTFLTAWQEKKREQITHPYLKEKLPWGLVPHVQALLLARHLRGDTDGYPPFTWK